MSARQSGPLGIYVQIDGKPVDLDEVSWYEKPPCGCPACGVHVARYGHNDEPITTPEQAARQFWPQAKEREKYVALGFTVFADLTSRVKELLAVDCPHTPRFGVPPRPEVDGYEWAAVHALGSSPKLMHLVTEIAIADARERRYGADNGRPLCGGAKAFWWKTEWYALDGKVECSRCLKKAEALQPEDDTPFELQATP